MKPRYDFSSARRGPVAAPAPSKTRITLRLDDTVLDWFRKRVHAEGGGNYQSLINQALLQHIAREDRAGAAQRLADALARLDALNAPPLSDEQIAAEIAADRAKRRRAERGGR